MKKLIALLLFLLPISAQATTTVTGTLQNLGTGTVGQGAFVRFYLRGCGGNIPRVNGTAIIAPSQGGVYYFDIAATSGGVISGTLYSTRDSTGLLGGDIECGGLKTSVWYGLQTFVGGKGSVEIPVHAKNGVALDITQVSPITVTPPIPTSGLSGGIAGNLVMAAGPTSATDSGIPTSSGSITLKNLAGAGANDLTLGIENQVHWACSLTAPIGTYRFPTVVAAIADIMTNSTNGGVVVTCPGHRETFTSQLDLGSASKVVLLQLNTDTILTCNVTTGGTNRCFNVHNGSGIIGVNTGSQGSSRTGGAVIQLATTGNVQYVINTPEGSDSNGQAFLTLSRIWIEALSGATATALINLEAISGMSDLNNVYVVNNSNNVTYGVRAVSNNNSVANQIGPHVLQNWWVYCQGGTNCTPLFMQANTQGVLPFNIEGGAYLHPGPAKPIIDIEGNGAGGHMEGVHISTYLENVQNGNSIGIKLVDASNVVIDRLVALMEGTTSGNPSADTIVDISQSGAGRSTLIDINGIFAIPFGGGNVNIVNDHITTKTIVSSGGQQFMGHYHYGSTNGQVFPFNIVANEFDVSSTNGTLLHSFPLSGNALLTGPVQINGSGNFSIGSVSNQFRIDTSSAISGAEYRFLTNSNVLTGAELNRIFMPGTTAPSGSANNEWLWFDSTDKLLKTNPNNTTAGPLVTAAPCTASQVTESGAATVLTCTPVAVAGSYRVRFVMSVSAANAATLGWTLTYTDSNGNAQTPTNMALSQTGVAAPALTFTTSAAGNYYGYADIDINNAGTAIVVKLTFTGTSFTAKVSATVERII